MVFESRKKNCVAEHGQNFTFAMPSGPPRVSTALAIEEG